MSVSVGSLVGLEWKAGVSLASSATRALNTPFVALQLTLKGPDGKLTSRHVQLTLAEFQAVLGGLLEAQKAMARI
jgi:hypothetical protein